MDQADGFEFVSEGAKKKKGYVATKPGMDLLLAAFTLHGPI